MFLHLPAILNAIGVIKCTYCVSLIIPVSHCILNFLIELILLMIVGFVLILIPEQGRRNDLLQRAVGGVPQDHGSPSTKIRSLHPNPISSQNIKSDSVHYDPSTQLIVSSGSSCHNADILKERMDKE